jgi:hypothetical protein
MSSGVGYVPGVGGFFVALVIDVSGANDPAVFRD